MDDPIIANKKTYWESNGQITRHVQIAELSNAALRDRLCRTVPGRCGGCVLLPVRQQRPGPAGTTGHHAKLHRDRHTDRRIALQPRQRKL